MRRLVLLPAFLLALNVLSGLAAGQTAAATTVTANPGTITVGSAVGLTATVQPSAAPGGGKSNPRPTGTITFLDGSTPLSGAPIALATNGLASATFPQTFGIPDPTLTALPTGIYSGMYTGEVVGDLNGDGVQDLLIYNFASPLSAQTFTSNGKGGYNTSAVQTLSFVGGNCSAGGYDVVSSPQLIDLNGDGKADLLCGIQVAYGNGDGTFAQAVPVPFLSTGFYTAYAADLNGDGKTDLLAVPTISETSGSAVQFALTVFLNQGGGLFTSAGTFPLAPISYLPGTGFFPPIVVDLNNDGKPDIISQTLTFGFTQEDNPQRSVNVLLNNGDGTFGIYMPVTLSTPPNNDGGPAPYIMGYGDVNGDGKADLILTLTDTAASVDAMVLLGNGDGTFQPQANLTLHAELGSSANQAPSVSVEDLNLDGKQDLIFGNGQVALGNGDGTFVLSTPLFAYPPGDAIPLAFPLVQVTLPGSLVPSLVYLLPTATPPAVSIFTPQTSSSGALSLTTLAVGTHTITARYSGDGNYSADTSAAVTVTVNQAVSTTAVTSSPDPSSVGQSVTLMAKVTSNGPSPTGNVTFTSGSTTLATIALSGGSAAYTTTSFTKVGTLAITASYSGDANTQASSAALSQVITGPTLTLSPSSITFPGQYVGTSGLPLTVTATNPGSAPLTITSVTTSSKDFGVLNACGGSLAAGSSCAIGVFFDPSSSGAVNGTLTIADNASGSPQTIPLSGSGQDFSFTSSSSTQTVNPGSTAAYTIAVNPIAGFNQTVALSCSGAPTGATCSLSPSSIALSGSIPASVTVSVTTQGNSAAATQPPNPQRKQVPIFFAICGLPGLLLLGVRRSGLCRGRTAAIYGAALLGIVCFVVAGCGGNSSNPSGGGIAANTYTLTVTGTFASGSAVLTHSTNLTMVVQ